jgi:hypothetical protein
MVAIVSDEPILAPSVFASSTLDEPIVELKPDAWKFPWEWLVANPRNWSSDVLSFLVSAD